MARYHTVYSRLWSSRDFRSWTEDGRLLALYLLTCPARTTEGLFRLPIPLAAYDLGWQQDRTGQALAELETAGFIAIDRDTDLVWLVNAVKWNAPRGPKQIKGAVNALSDVPSSPLRVPYLDRCRSVSPELADAISTDLKWQPYPIEGVSEGLPNPSDCSSSFSFSNTTPPTPPSPQTQADPDSAGPVVVAAPADAPPLLRLQGAGYATAMTGKYLNGYTAEEYPRVVHGDIEAPPLEEVATFINQLVQAGALTPESDCWAMGRSRSDTAAESAVMIAIGDVWAACVSAKTRSRRSW